MPPPRKISADEITEIGEALYGPAWQGAMAKALGVPRQSVSYYLKTGGVNGAQAAGIVGLLARVVLEEDKAAEDHRQVLATRRDGLVGLLARLRPA